MADETAPFLEIGDVLKRLQRVREWARESGPPDIYIDMVEACAFCEALADPEHPANKTVDVRHVAARLRRQGLHLVRNDDEPVPTS